MQKIVTFVLSILFMTLSLTAFANDHTPAGLWKTIDDKTGKPRSLIRISDHNGEFRAVVEKGLRETDTGEAVCDKCTDDRKGQKIIGMTIAKGLKKTTDNNYEGGEILDPESGKIYKCKLKLSDDGKSLEVRGFIGISLLGRSQTWHREE